MLLAADLTPQIEAIGNCSQRNPSADDTIFLFYSRQFHDALGRRVSEFWRSKLLFDRAFQGLGLAASLPSNWNTYGSEPPNESSRILAAKVLKSLEKVSLAPCSLIPSSEGGITISFVNGHNRAMIETYNTGEAVAATYFVSGNPEVWEFEPTESSLQAAIDQIRVHLAK